MVETTTGGSAATRARPALRTLNPNLSAPASPPKSGRKRTLDIGPGADRYLDQFEERRQDENWRRLASDETPKRLSGGFSALLGPRGTSPAVVAYREEECAAYTQRTGLRASGWCAGAGVPEAAETRARNQGKANATFAGLHLPPRIYGSIQVQSLRSESRRR